MFYPYCIIEPDTRNIEVTHTELKEDRHVTVRFTQLSSNSYKLLECRLPDYNIENIIAFSEAEVTELMEFCKCNAALIIKYSQTGGIENA